jgi:hypothetical protein
MDMKESIDLSCGVPVFKEIFKLSRPHKKLKKETLLVRYQMHSYYTVRGWYADKHSRASKEYLISGEDEIAGLVEFVDYYQIRGKRVSDKYLYDLLPSQFKKC